VGFLISSAHKPIICLQIPSCNNLFGEQLAVFSLVLSKSQLSHSLIVKTFENFAVVIVLP
jgi:hypothetical protein